MSESKASFELKDGTLCLVFCQGLGEEAEAYLRAHPLSLAGDTPAAECARTDKVVTRVLGDDDKMSVVGYFGIGRFSPTHDRESGELSGVRVEYV